METNKDYSKLTLEELIQEQKKLKRNEIYAAFGIGLLFGILGFGIVQRGFGWVYVSISFFLIYMIFKGSKENKENLKQIKSEIMLKNKIS